MINNPVILFDGVCNLCNGTVDFLIRRDRKKQFRFVALQSNGGEKIMEKYNISADFDSVILIYDGKIYYESDAALKIVSLLHFPWNLAKLFRIIPLKLRDRIYKWVALNRYKWFGKGNSCRVPSPEEQEFFPGPDELER